MNRTMIVLWVGIFVTASAVAVMVRAGKVGNASTTFNMGDSYRIYARFENIGGLKPRAPVKSAGVLVGRVDEIQFDSKSFTALVTLNIDQRYTFPKDTSVSI